MELRTAFLNGLKEYDLTLDDMNNWKYCGGTKNLNYFNLTFKGRYTQPEHQDRCVCGHRIVEQCYITDGKETLTLGNCCVKRFIQKHTKTCEDCGKPHKKKTTNKCDACIPKRPAYHVECIKCNEWTKNRKLQKCNACRFGKCDVCDKPCNPQYNTCWKCKFIK